MKLDLWCAPFAGIAAVGVIFIALAWSQSGLSWYGSSWRFLGPIFSDKTFVTAGTLLGIVIAVSVALAALLAKTQWRFLAASAISLLIAGVIALFTRRVTDLAFGFSPEWILAVSIVGFLLIPAVTFSLGLWMVERKKSRGQDRLAKRWGAAETDGACAIRVASKQDSTLKVSVLWRGGQETEAICESDVPEVGDSFILFNPAVTPEADRKGNVDYRKPARIDRLRFASAVVHPFEAPQKPSRFWERFIVVATLVATVGCYAVAYAASSSVLSKHADKDAAVSTSTER